ncbi:MAG: riboflavin biosynthesis protein RibF, partial [Enterovibrio sp.]
DQVPPARLCHFRDKYRYIAQLGIDNLLLVNFNSAFAALEASDFVNKLLAEQLGVQHLLVGDDFVFGKNKAGSFSYLQQNAPFTVERSASLTLPIGVDETPVRVSSTAIRALLQAGDFEQAALMLGRPYCIEGSVFHGEKRGRQLGFPTANLLIKRKYCALKGVFAIAAQTKYGRFLGVANIGSRPTLGGERVQLEVHLFDFNGDLYGQRIEVQFHHKLRDEQKFASLPALQRQIESDALAAQAWLKLHNISGHDGK